MIVVSMNDFVGPLAIARGPYTDEGLQKTIDLYEKDYIYKLLGQAIADLFIADLTNGIPNSTRFKAILDTFFKQQGNKQHNSKGMKYFLDCAIYYYYVKDNQANVGQSGVTTSQTETANNTSLTTAARQGEKYFNESLNTVDAIQWMLKTNPTTYPEYSQSQGMCIRPKLSWAL